MRNFGTLYLFELKKIMKKKMTRITLIIMLGLIAFGHVSNLFFAYYDMYGNKISAYEKMLEEREYGRRLSGRRIDDALIREMQAAYGGHQVIAYEKETSQQGMFENTHSIAVTAEYMDDGRPAEEVLEAERQYDEIYTFAGRIAGYENIHNIDAEKLYHMRRDSIQTWNEPMQLTDGEYAYWEKQEEKIEKPFTYEYHYSALQALVQVNFLTYLSVFAIAICLSGVFPDEHLRRTDSLTLSSRYGRKRLYFAKLAAGTTFGVGVTALFTAFGILLLTIIYGTDGFHTALQICLWQSSWAVSIGGAVLLAFFVSLAASLVCSVFTMFLSEGLRNSIATLGIVTGFTLLLLFIGEPPRRMAAQIIHLFPTRLIDESGFLENRLFSIFGTYVTNFQMAAAVYLLTALICACAGYRIYERYQVSGR